jgi:hypothetical protein
MIDAKMRGRRGQIETSRHTHKKSEISYFKDGLVYCRAQKKMKYKYVHVFRLSNDR